MTDSLISEFYGWLDQEEEHELDEEKKAAEEEVRIVSPPPDCSPTAAAYRSICTSKTAAMYAAEYKVPPEFGLCAPRSEERVHAPPPGYATVYTHQFKYRLTLPLQPFVASLLAHFGITLAQLHPKGIIFILGFQEICRRTSVSPTPALFRRFFRFQKNRHTYGWYTFRSIGPEIVSHSSLRHWKASFLYFKTAPITENLDLSWNYSPVVDPQVAENDRPSDQTINRLLACIKSSSKHKRGAVQQPPLEQEAGKMIGSINGIMKAAGEMQAKKSSMENETCSQMSPAARASIATLKPSTASTELPSWKERLKRKAEFDATEHAKIPRGPTEKKCVDECSQVPLMPSFKDKTLDKKCFCSLHLQLHGDKVELEKVVEENLKERASLQGEKEELEKVNALLKAEVSRLQSVMEENLKDSGPYMKVLKKVMVAMQQEAKEKDEEIDLLKSQLKRVIDDQSRLKSVVDDRGPLLKVYTQKLLETQAFARLLYDLTALAQRLGRHEAAEQIQDLYAAVKLENLFCDVFQDYAFKFTLLDHLLSLPEIPTSSQLKHLDVDVDHDSLISLPPLHVKVEEPTMG